MTRSFLARYVSPWALRRDKEEQRRIAALRGRDGDTCRRCRKALSFDLPDGHDKGPRIERIGGGDGEPGSLDALCLCHVRCNAAGSDHTDEVTERIRRKSEAALLANARKRKRKSA